MPSGPRWFSSISITRSWPPGAFRCCASPEKRTPPRIWRSCANRSARRARSSSRLASRVPAVIPGTSVLRSSLRNGTPVPARWESVKCRNVIRFSIACFSQYGASTTDNGWLSISLMRHTDFTARRRRRPPGAKGITSFRPQVGRPTKRCSANETPSHSRFLQDRKEFGLGRVSGAAVPPG
jgi:hypothetical protein